MYSTITNKKFIIIGFTASLLLLGLYFVVLSLANSFSHAIEQFSQMWYWILLLVAGFGFQVGLYFYIRASFRLKQMVSPTTAVAASGSISTGSMIACCLHHLVDVLPLMGLAAAAVFLTQYQLLFIIIGILSNLIGITIMLEIIQKHKLSEGFLNKILIYNMGQVKKITIGSSLILFLITFFLINNLGETSISAGTIVSSEINNEEKSENTNKKIINLLSKTDVQGEISFEVTPLQFSLSDPLKIEVRIDTHSGSLDFDPARISKIEDDIGNQYQPLKWEGSSSGGHHRSGTLFFSSLDGQAKKIKLIIQDAYLRIFEWDLE